MLDLETLSTRPHAVILVIGAIKFNRNEKWIEEPDINRIETFYVRIKIDSCIDAGLHVDPQTKKWWSEQNDDIKYEALEHPDRIPLKDALIQFKKWVGNNSSHVKIWGNGSSFDCGILGESYKRCDIEAPWKFWNERDLRTIMDLGEVKMCDLPQGKLHHALYDCYRQILGFQMSENNIKFNSKKLDL